MDREAVMIYSTWTSDCVTSTLRASPDSDREGYTLDGSLGYLRERSVVDGSEMERESVRN